MEKANNIDLPNFHHEGDVACDIRSSESVILEPGKMTPVETGLKMQIPDGYAGLVWEKSGLAFNKHIKTAGGVIDSGYRGEIKIALVNMGNSKYEVERGDKIAQMLIQKVEKPEVVEVDTLKNSSRGEDGFGSTGKK
jgi:dUTP pyrophosphatase